MFYKKPDGITYTEMAIWIDNNAYNPECDQIKLYEYLYHLVYMLAVKGRYFNSASDYDNFSLQTASNLF